MLDEWVSACQALRASLGMAVGTRPLRWVEKRALVFKVRDHFDRVLTEWSLNLTQEPNEEFELHARAPGLFRSPPGDGSSQHR